MPTTGDNDSSQYPEKAKAKNLCPYDLHWQARKTGSLARPKKHCEKRPKPTAKYITFMSLRPHAVGIIIPDGAVLSIVRSGYYDNGAEKKQWHWEIYASQKGWIRTSDLEKIP
ncbi:MAG: hypothetical protein OIF58_16015, partial [Cohaesibacter sp.]|nr:hypothetical protein [Cohaesibacter sp.]